MTPPSCYQHCRRSQDRTFTVQDRTRARPYLCAPTRTRTWNLRIKSGWWGVRLDLIDAIITSVIDYYKTKFEVNEMGLLTDLLVAGMILDKYNNPLKQTPVRAGDAEEVDAYADARTLLGSLLDGDGAPHGAIQPTSEEQVRTVLEALIKEQNDRVLLKNLRIVINKRLYELGDR